MSLRESKIPFTASAFQKMEERLSFLQEKRIEVLERLKSAREMGDLSENGAYRYAKFELGNIGREMRRLQYLLSHGEVVTKKSSEKIEFGSTVLLQAGEKKYEYLLVSEHESDPHQGKLSLASPLGMQLIGKKQHDSVHVDTSKGSIEYRILDVR